MGFKPGDGALVTAVDADGPAAESGIQPGDVITSVNRKPITKADDFRKAIEEARKAKTILLRVRNEKGARFVAIERKKP